MMENIPRIGGNLTSYELHKLISHHWMKYSDLSQAMHLILGVFVIIVGLVSVTANGFIVWMFCR